MIFHLVLVLGCQLAGELVARAAGIPLPGPVLGMVLLFAGLLAFGLPEGLARVADALLGNLSLLFVPAGVGVMLHGALIARDAVPISVALVVSTLVAVAVTGLMMRALGPRSGDGGEKG